MIVPFHAYPETWTPEGVRAENHLGPSFATGFVRTVDRSWGPKPIWINETGFATVEGRSERDQAESWSRAVAFHTIQRLAALLGSMPVAIDDGSLVVTAPDPQRADVFAHVVLRADGAQLLFVWARRDATVSLDLRRAGSCEIEYRIDGAPKPAQPLEGRALSRMSLTAGEVRPCEIRP